MKNILIAGILTVFSTGATLADNAKMPKLSEPEIKPFIVKPGQQTKSEDIKLSRAPRRAKAKDVPFIEDFSNASTLNDWFIQDVNNDGDSWEYDANNKLLKCYFATSGKANNDWVITPAINLGADDIYTLSFSYGSQGTRFSPEHLTVTMGKSEYGTQHTTVLFDDAEIQNFWNGSMITVTVTLPVEEDGAYYFGFHCTSPNTSYCLYLDDVKVEQNGAHAAPEASTDFSVVPDNKGALSAAVSLTAPSFTADGKAISSNLDDVKVYRDNSLVHTFASPVPGSTLGFTDSGMTNGMHTYTAIASLNRLEGAKSESTVFIGIDTPVAVANVKAVEDGTSVTLTWDAPTGQNGGYVGDDVVKYRIVRFAGEEEKVVSTNAAERKFVDSNLPTDVQNHLFYEVTAYTTSGSAEASESNSVFFGPAYPIPFSESFGYCELAKSPWVMEYLNTGWLTSSWYLVAMGSYPTCPPIDGDDGMALFQCTAGSMNLYGGNEIRLATPAIDLKGTKEPFVSFYLFHYDTTTYSTEYDEENDEYYTSTNSYNDRLRLQVSVDNGEYVDVPEAEIYLNANNKGWTKYTFPLDAYKNASKLSLGLVGVADGGGNICIDQLLITDRYDNDIEVTGLLGPQSIREGQTGEYVCNIVNNGTTSTKDYTVSLYLDDEEVSNQQGQGAAIFANGGEKTIRFSFTPRHKDTGSVHRLYAKVNFAADECAANDISEIIELDVPANDLPRVETLHGTQEDNKVTLIWDEPQMTDVKTATTDDMERYTPFAISNIGSYYLIDNDKSATYGIDGIDDYDNAGAAMAWQVFNPGLTSLDLELNFNRRWLPRSGNQYVMSWASNSAVNDDWFISPLLSGEEQTISFYIKSVTLAYTERFRVLYSTDGRTMNDFVKIGEPNYYNPSSKWRKFSAKLPKGAKYFAIQCVSSDGFGIMVDDITYIPANAKSAVYDFMGYNVYRDGEKINATPLAEALYEDEVADGEAHSYAVTALYSQGESSPSATWSSEMSGMDDLSASTPVVRGLTSAIEVSGHNGELTVYTLDGRTVVKTLCGGYGVFRVPTGVYAVRCGNTVVKVLVK